MIRKPIITVLGHVDAGKSSLLDRIRGTDIVAKEAGGITQHIGATEVPIKIIRKISGKLIEKYKFNITLPGLLFIDTPGHEAFVNLRKRGGSIADLAVLVVDVTKGCENQTCEAIDILKTYKTPFIVVANKIDRISGWRSTQESFTNSVTVQTKEVVEQLDKKLYELVGELHSHGFESERFDRCSEFTKQIPIIPVCARTGEGLHEVLMFLAGLSQKYLEKKLNIEVSGKCKGTVLEVTEDKGLGKTINVIIYEGKLKVGDEIVVGGKNGAVTTKIRALLEPKPLGEIRASQEKFKNINEVSAAAGVKIAAPGLGDVLSGSPLRVVSTGNEVEEVNADINKLRIDSDIEGPIVKTDALGSLEAFVKMLEDRNIKVRLGDIGEVTRRDVMEMESVRKTSPYLGVIFAFHTKVNPDAEEEAGKRGVRIFSGSVIYKLIEDYEKWVNEAKDQGKKNKLKTIVLPAEFELLPGNVFHNTKPAIVGVRISEGRLRSKIKVMNAKGIVIGKAEVIQKDGKNVELASKGDEVAVSIEGATIGRNLHEGDVIFSVIPEKQLKSKEWEELLEGGENILLEKIKKLQADVRKKEVD